MLKGEFKGKTVIKITVQDEENLKFEGVKDKKKAKEKTVVVHAKEKD